MSATNNNSANCALCAQKILDFIATIKNDDYAYLCFDNKKINMKTKKIEPTTVPFIYSTAEFGTNVMLCNDDEYIKKVVVFLGSLVRFRFGGVSKTLFKIVIKRL